MRWIEQAYDAAARSLPAPVLEYFTQGAQTGVAAAEATSSWDAIRLRPRVLRDVSAVSTRAVVMGHSLDTPVLVAPTTLRRAAHPDGEVACARGAAAAGSLLCVSSNAGTKFDQIGEAAGPWWLQLYLSDDRARGFALARAARDVGSSAVVLTVDTPVVGAKHHVGQSVWDVVDPDLLLANMDVPESVFTRAADLTVDDIPRLRDAIGLPVIVKGVLRGDDAAACVSAGAAAVWVSNHGGRQLDLAVSTAVALSEIVAAVAGTGAEVYVDGGLRRGEHALAALAMGADAVFVGRPALYGLAADGAAGVAAVLEELTGELTHAMTLAGAASLDELTPDLVV